ncbi:hypothetical protein KAJ41_00540 [Candidatus Parcubacteria bacterium]|nr:hypothetical protein [Candidatus Parcubacteria bacterium]
MKEENDSLLSNYQELWNRVDKDLEEGSYSGYKMAIIETEKILAVVLDDKKFSGKNTDEKIHNVKNLLHNPEKLDYARSMYKKIIQEPGFDVSENDTKEILTGYYDSISNIAEIRKKDSSKRERIKLLLSKYYQDIAKKIKKISFVVIFSLSMILILTDTSPGKATTQVITDFTRFLFYTVLFGVVKILFVVLIIVGLLYYWKSRKDK